MFIGVDIEDVSRFQNKTLENDSKFLKRIFTIYNSCVNEEVQYTFQKADIVHLKKKKKN